jgi:hypothetical protein
MNNIKETVSLCEHCYRHIPAMRIEKDNQIWLGKTCPVHGYVEHLVEPDAAFYNNYTYPNSPLQAYFIEVTNKCNLNCPHCYQMPDNLSTDNPIEILLDQIKSYPDDGYAISLVGAEPTMRKDLLELIIAIQALPGLPRRILILTNAVNMAKDEYASQFQGLNNVFWTIGLNHPDYQGKTVRAKQLKGILNCVKFGYKIKNISYTLENLDQLEYCLQEIQQFDPETCKQFRIRCGADIGRNPKDPTIYLSQLVNEVKKVADRNSWSCVPHTSDGIRSHYPLVINGIFVKIIQWPDVKTLDLEEKQTESWADIVPGKPVSPLVHQVILRDALVNNGMMLFDTVPKKYRRIHD